MSIPGFTLRQLEIFASVMETGRIRASAQALHLSQSAVSQALQELSQALGVQLFRRQGRLLEPTRAAQRLLALSHEPRAELNRLARRLQGAAPVALAGPVQIAASTTIARYLLPGAVARLSTAWPQLALTLTSGNSAEVEARVAAGQVDLGLIEGPPRRHDVQAEHWRTDHLEIIGPSSAPAALTPQALAHWPWVMRESGSGTRAVFEQSLAMAGLTVPRASLTADDSDAQVRMVAAGGGLACVSRAAARAAAATGSIRFISLDGHVFARPLWSIWPVNPADMALAETLLTALDRQMGAEQQV